MAGVDNIYLVISFLVGMLVLLSMTLAWNALSDVDVLWDSEKGAGIQEDTQDFVDKWDFIMTCLYIGLHLSILVLAWLLRTHPVVMLLGIFMLLLLVVLSAPISNAYETMSTDPAFASVVGDYPMMNHIMLRLPFYELIWGALSLIIMFGFARMGEEYL